MSEIINTIRVHRGGETSVSNLESNGNKCLFVCFLVQTYFLLSDLKKKWTSTFNKLS